jgi:hypothetical protein
MLANIVKQTDQRHPDRRLGFTAQIPFKPYIMNSSTLQIKIQKFVIQYGPEQLIEWLDEFDCMGGPNKFRMFKKIEKLACDAFGITIADMHRMSTAECTDAKRVISFIAANRIDLPHPVIAKLLGNVSLRSVAYYIKDAEIWINDPKTNRQFVDTYNMVFEKYAKME